MRLTTIGTGTSAPSSTRVSAGHLVEAGGVRLLLDCGSGVVHRMAALGLDWMGITHVAITHFDADHISDLPTLVLAWRYGALPARTAPVELVGPPGTGALLMRLGGAFGRSVQRPDYPLTVRELASGQRLSLGDALALEARAVPHTVESIAYCVWRGARRVVYTGDTGFDPALAAWAHGCDVLLTECSLPEVLAIPSHLTPRQCAELAAAAEPKQLVLTHFYPPVERVDIPGVIAAHYRGPVTLATDGWTTEIEDE